MTTAYGNPMMDLNHICMKHRFTISEEYSCTGPSHCPSFVCNLKISAGTNTIVLVSEGTNKKDAKFNAALQFVEDQGAYINQLLRKPTMVHPEPSYRATVNTPHGTFNVACDDSESLLEIIKFKIENQK